VLSIIHDKSPVICIVDNFLFLRIYRHGGGGGVRAYTTHIYILLNVFKYLSIWDIGHLLVYLKLDLTTRCALSENPQEEIRRWDPSVGVASATTPPSSWFLDPDIYSLEREAVFKK
jgi:hypothetical protein